ncbi:protein TIFY 10b-like [Curcuma longa]|uniref:protein TIFY 10b-like n=1 Tax=Curcuma longa TaxID=136217 RepID=UPI003D9EBDD4
MAARKQGKTNFAVACNLLSQCIKEKRSITDLGLGFDTRPQGDDKGNLEAFRPPTTMRLLPGAEISGEDDGEGGEAMELFPQRAEFNTASEEARERGNPQLTIFYGGKVMVFDNFPPEKANDLLKLAGEGIKRNQILGQESSSSEFSKDQNPTLESMAANSWLTAEGLARSAQPSLSDLPIARKASLQRFLEKRKDRINARAPYQVKTSGMDTPFKQEKSRSWLGLTP